MRHIAISVISLIIALPAFADVRLPVVNLAAGGVSARAAFGEEIVQPEKKVEKISQPVVASNNKANNTERENNNTRRVVARSATPQKTVTKQARVNTDSGEQIVASADILAPRRPSTDLWAHNTGVASDVAPLRLPSPDEFSVIRSDDILPEESLDSTSRSVTRVANAAPVSASQRSSIAPVQQSSEPLSELDAQIARLNELQRRAEESVRDDYARAESDFGNNVATAPVATTPRVASRNVVARPTMVNSHDDNAPFVARNMVQKTADVSTTDDGINLSRMVVPMDDMSDDVVVRAVKRAESPRIASVREDMTKMTPGELRRAFRKTFLSENKHLSTFQIDDRFDVASDMTANAAGFTSARDLSETGGIRPLEIKIKFRNGDAALSRDNYNLLTEYAGIVLSNPTRAIQVSIPQSVVSDGDERKLAARRLAIIEQVLRDNGISEQRILPVLAQRDTDDLLLRMISLEQYETLTKQQRDIFGDTVSKKTYRSMSW